MAAKLLLISKPMKQKQLEGSHAILEVSNVGIHRYRSSQIIRPAGLKPLLDHLDDVAQVLAV